MKLLLSSALIASLVFLIIDLIWLSISVKYFYRPYIGQLLLDKPIMWAAGLFYITYMVGMTIIVIQPTLESGLITRSIYHGFILGLVAYGTYNLTNMAVLKGWSINVVIVDMIWGGFLTALSSSIGILIAKKLFN